MPKRIELITRDGVVGKKCSKCKYWSSLEDYYNDKSNWTGKCSICKRCTQGKNDKRKVGNTSIKGTYEFTCPNCGEKFTTGTGSKTFCSAKCRKADWYRTDKEQKLKLQKIPVVIKGLNRPNV